jgi:flavorubredoxin
VGHKNKIATAGRTIMRKLAANIYEVGAVDWNRRLFDELIPLPDGTSYNAYLIKGSQKTALLDTVDPTKADVLLNNLAELQLDRIDYVVSHHAEQDHSGAIPQVLARYPQAMVLANPRCKQMLIDLLCLRPDRLIEVADGQQLPLGGKTLQFVYIPWVHWPETMGTYLPEDKILFTCDLFGSHLAASSLFVDDEPLVYEAAKRYYAEIMMPFRAAIKANLEKIKHLDISTLAPSHGPVYQRPQFILDAYKDWTSDEVKNEVVVAYVSMHGSTRRMVEHLVRQLAERSIKVRQLDLARTDIGKLAAALVDAATIVLAAPTVLTGPHPATAYAATLTAALRPKTRFVAVIGSYGWGGKMTEQLNISLATLRAEILEPVLIKGFPRHDDLQQLTCLAENILAKHKQAGIVT